jgi:hypothetical protein
MSADPTIAGFGRWRFLDVGDASTKLLAPIFNTNFPRSGLAVRLEASSTLITPRES